MMSHGCVRQPERVHQQLQFQMECFRQPPRAPMRSHEQVRPVLLHLVPVLQAPVHTVKIEKLLALLDPLPGFSPQQIRVIVVTDRAKRHRQHQPALRIHGQMMLRFSQRLRQWPGRPILRRSRHHRYEMRLLARLGLVKITKKRRAVRRQPGGLQQRVVAAQLPMSALAAFAGMHRPALGQIKKARQRMLRFPAGLDEILRVQFRENLLLRAPAFIQREVGKRFPVRRQRRVQSIHVLHPHFHPFTHPSARVRDAPKINQRVMQIPQHHKTAHHRIGRLPHQYAQPHRRAVVFMEGDGAITLGNPAGWRGGWFCRSHVASTLSFQTFLPR